MQSEVCSNHGRLFASIIIAVKYLFKKGASLILACRDIAKAKEIRHRLIQDTYNINISVEYLDLSSFSSTKAFADRIVDSQRTVYALINNAGIFYQSPRVTEDGIDVTFQTNYLGPFLLTLLLLPVLRANATGARIVNVSSQAHLAPTDFKTIDPHQPYEDTCQNRFAAYQYSKFYLVLFANRLNRLLQNSKVTVHCVDPGNVETNIFRTFPPLSNPLLFALQKPIRLICIKTPNEGAQSIVHALLATAPSFYIANLSESRTVHFRAFDPSLAEALWLTSRKLCAGHLTSAI